MAYISQEKKAKIAPVIKAILKNYDIKGTLSIHNHSTLSLNIKSGPIDFIGNANAISARHANPQFREVAKDYIQVNPYWYHEHFSGEAKAFLKKVLEAMNDGNHDNSRIEIDYFDVGWYVNVNIGRWDRPYKLT